MSVGADVAARQIAGRVAATIEPVFAMVDEWRDALERRLGGGSPGEPSAPERTAPSAAALDPIVAALVCGELERDGSLITGAGFVAKPGFLADAPWHLAWWLGGSNTLGPGSGLRPLATVDDPDSEQFRDYTTLEWWRVPARTGTRHLTGPYVDYLCTDDYTVTITTPVSAGGELAGLVGTDLYVARLEQVLLPVIRGAGHPCTLVNASGRIVAATDARRATGALLRLAGLAEALAPLREAVTATDAATLAGGEVVVPCGDTSLALVVEP